MKSKLTILVAIFVCVLSVQAQKVETLPKEMFGFWRGIRVETIGGIAYTGAQTLRINPIQGGRGANVSSSISFGAITLVATGSYTPDGIYSAQAFLNGNLFSTTTGTWTMNRRGIGAMAVTRDVLGGVYSGDASLRLVAGQRGLIVQSLLSTGGTVSIRLTR